IGFADGGARDETGEIIVVHDRGRGPLVPCERDETRVGALEGVRRIVRVTKDADRERPDEPLRRLVERPEALVARRADEVLPEIDRRHGSVARSLALARAAARNRSACRGGLLPPYGRRRRAMFEEISSSGGTFASG